MTVRVDMFEEDENREAYNNLLARNAGKDGYGFKYQSKQEQAKQLLYKSAINMLLDDVEKLPKVVDAVFMLLKENE